MDAEHALSVLIPLAVLAVLWTLVRHWILPFVLGFALAVALGRSARPLMASAWAAVANVGEAIFGRSRDDIADRREPYLDRRGPAPGQYGECPEIGGWRREPYDRSGRLPAGGSWMGWVLRLVETGTDSRARSVDMMEISRPNDL